MVSAIRSGASLIPWKLSVPVGKLCVFPQQPPPSTSLQGFQTLPRHSPPPRVWGIAPLQTYPSSSHCSLPPRCRHWLASQPRYAFAAVLLPPSPPKLASCKRRKEKTWASPSPAFAQQAPLLELGQGLWHPCKQTCLLLSSRQPLSLGTAWLRALGPFPSFLGEVGKKNRTSMSGTRILVCIISGRSVSQPLQRGQAQRLILSQRA